jgi:hypothetical protein
MNTSRSVWRAIPRSSSRRRNGSAWSAGVVAFVHFTLEWKRDDTVWIAFSGGPGVKDFLAAEILGSKPSAAPDR